MNIGLIIIITLIFFAILGGMVFAVIHQLKKTDEKTEDSSIKNEIETAQDFLPFKNIKDGVVDLGGHEYRAIIECSSTNYNLKTDNEKEIIELSFQRFLNSLTFPITVFVQTKVIDNSKMLNHLRKETKTVIKDHPQMEDYASNYYEEMSRLNEHIGNNKQKKKYIIVPYNEAINLGELSNEEKYNYSIKELKQRALIIADGLSTVGVKTKLLGTRDLAELIYSTYHKDNYGHYENIVNGEFLPLIVEEEKNPEEALTIDKRIDWVLYEAQTRLKTELLDKELPNHLSKECENIIFELEKIRENVIQND